MDTIKTIPEAAPSIEKNVKSKKEKISEMEGHYEVEVRKKPLLKKLQETFITDDVGSVRNFLIFDVIIPSIKETVSESVSKGLDMMLFGDARQYDSGKKSNSPYISYNNYSNNRKEQRREPSRDLERKNYSDYETLIFKDRGKAEACIRDMTDILYDYKEVTVADLYSILEMTGQFTDNYYGWTNLSTAKAVRVRGGYILDLPKPIHLEP